MTLVLVITAIALVVWFITKPITWIIGALASFFAIVGCACTLHIFGALLGCVAFIACVFMTDLAREDTI